MDNKLYTNTTQFMREEQKKLIDESNAKIEKFRKQENANKLINQSFNIYWGDNNEVY